MLYVNNGFATLENLYATLENTSDNTLHKAFMSNNDNDNESIAEFMKELRSMVMGRTYPRIWLVTTITITF